MFRSLMESSQSALLIAIDRQDSIETNRILQQFPSEVSIKDSEERVALHYAAESMNVETVKRILDNDPSLLDCTDSQGYTPLVMAVQAGRNDVIEFLLDRGASISQQDADGHSLVQWAVVCGQLETLNLLIERGADVTTHDKFKATALHYATANDELPDNVSTSILLTLIRKGAPINSRDVDERTPLLWSASNGNIDGLVSLKQSGGDILSVDRDRMSALHMSASHGSAMMTEKMLDIVPSSMINQSERSGCTPLFYSVNYGYYEPSRLLLSKGANTNHQDHRLRTPAHLAATKGQLRILKLLKQFGASFEMQNYRGDLPLHEAVQTGTKDVVEWLLALHPSSINAACHSGRTPLHIAAARGHMSIVILLCNQSAYINPLMLYRNELVTPLDLAKRQEHSNVVDYLTMRQGAMRAEDIPEEERRDMREHIEESMNEAKLKYGKKIRIGEEEDEMESKKTRKRDESMESSVNGKGERMNHVSSIEGKRIPRSTSTSDLKDEEDEDYEGNRLVEERIERIVREELRAVRNGKNNEDEKKEERSSSKKRRRQKRSIEIERQGISTSEEEVSSNERRTKRSARSSERDKEDKKKNGKKKEEKVIELVYDDSEEDNEKHSEKENGTEKEEKDDDKKETNLKRSSSKKGKNRLTPIEDEGDIDIFEDEWEELSDQHPTGKDAQRRYIHEKSIFQELTHLKRMQIQYGKVQERVLVHSLVGNFCKMHGLNPADYKFSSFYSWEKYLYEQLKSIYVEERERLITNNSTVPRQSQAARLNKFETRLRQARAVPLNDRIRELTRIYGSASITAGKKAPQKRDIFPGQKRCDCLGKHLLVKST